MKGFLKFVLKYSWCMYMGAVVSIAGVYILNWKWWVIVLPIIVLVELSKQIDKIE